MKEIDIEKMYIVAKSVYKREHINKTVTGLEIEQIVAGNARNSFWITIDIFSSRIEANRKLNKSDLSKLENILQGQGLGWYYPTNF